MAVLAVHASVVRVLIRLRIDKEELQPLHVHVLTRRMRQCRADVAGEALRVGLFDFLHQCRVRRRGRLGHLDVVGTARLLCNGRHANGEQNQNHDSLKDV
jgi:hypothetical protein